MSGQLPPPYGQIRDQLLRGQVIPFLGAGASFGSRKPKETWWRTAPGDDGDIAFLPTASELADFLATKTSFPADESRELAKVAEYFSAVNGSTPLKQWLQDIFSFKQASGPVHKYLAEVAKKAPLLIVTTNYDDLIEHAFDTAKPQQPYDTVIHVTSPKAGGEVLWHPYGKTPLEVLGKDLLIDLSKITVIYKMHGGMDRSSNPPGQYVITEDDYIDFLTRMTKRAAIPNAFADPFQSRPFLFLGYGLHDWNLRVVLNRIDKEMRRPGEIKSWAIEALSKPLEKKLWEQRNVNVFDGLSLDEFVDKLRTPPDASSAVKP
ncbi:MAG: SIR2 family protein [Gammaproteobacteria bacterium]|nr:SIR2 family protein [Gammaproteobacteria bacterium]